MLTGRWGSFWRRTKRKRLPLAHRRNRRRKSQEVKVHRALVKRRRTCVLACRSGSRRWRARPSRSRVGVTGVVKSHHLHGQEHDTGEGGHSPWPTAPHLCGKAVARGLAHARRLQHPDKLLQADVEQGLHSCRQMSYKLLQVDVLQVPRLFPDRVKVYDQVQLIAYRMWWMDHKEQNLLIQIMTDSAYEILHLCLGVMEMDLTRK